MGAIAREVIGKAGYGKGAAYWVDGKRHRRAEWHQQWAV